MRSCKPILASIPIVLTTLLIGSCRSDNPSEPINDRSRLVPGVSIDGVEFGDYPEVVEQKIGKPQQFGWSSGPRAMLGHRFTEGVHKGLSIWYIEGFVADTMVWGPADYLEIDTLYEGKTKEGIGIGSTAISVISTWGLPAKMDSLPRSDLVLFRYYFKGKTVTLIIEENVIVRLGMGYFMDPP